MSCEGSGKLFLLSVAISRSARPFASLRAAAGGVAISRRTVAKVEWETPTCTAPYVVGEIPTCTAPNAVRCKCRFARNDFHRFTSLRASAASVAISRTTAAKAVREIPTCTAPNAVRCKCRFARNDINHGVVRCKCRFARNDIKHLTLSPLYWSDQVLIKNISSLRSHSCTLL